MARRLISSGSTFEKSIGYSRAVVDGDWVSCRHHRLRLFHHDHRGAKPWRSGEQALRNIAAALKEAGASFADVVRVHYLLTNAGTSSAAGPPWARCSARSSGGTMMVVGLADRA
jgi:hypothetical protein